MALSHNVFSSPNRVTRIQYQILNYPSFSIVGEMDNVSSCSITEDASAAIKVTGTLTYEGDLQVNPLNQLVRVNSISEADGVTTVICHGTFFVSSSSQNLKENGTGGTLKLFSTLQAAKDILGRGTYTQKANSSPWSALVWLAGIAKVKLLSEEITYTVKEEKVYKSGDDWLKIANELLVLCGYVELLPTPTGDWTTKKYLDPTSRGVTTILKDSGENPIISGREISRDIDLSSVPNVSAVVLSPSDKDAQPQIATATNNDRKSPYSVINRGREIRTVETYTELPISVRDKAIENLRKSMQVTESYSLDMLWNDIALGDVVQIDYERLGLVGVKAEVTKRTTKMSAGLISSVELTRVLDTFDIEVS